MEKPDVGRGIGDLSTARAELLLPNPWGPGWCGAGAGAPAGDEPLGEFKGLGLTRLPQTPQKIKNHWILHPGVGMLGTQRPFPPEHTW